MECHTTEISRKYEMLSAAGNRLPELIEKCISGEEIIIFRRGKVAASWRGRLRIQRICNTARDS